VNGLWPFSASHWPISGSLVSVLPPELRRRFTLGAFFLDLPTVDERETIWRIYNEPITALAPLPSEA
jgi:hypothetical protein